MDKSTDNKGNYQGYCRGKDEFKRFENIFPQIIAPDGIPVLPEYRKLSGSQGTI
jgi:hypothetical protein